MLNFFESPVLRQIFVYLAGAVIRSTRELGVNSISLQSCCRLCMRFMPVEHSCQAALEDIRSMASKLVPAAFPAREDDGEPVTVRHIFIFSHRTALAQLQRAVSAPAGAPLWFAPPHLVCALPKFACIGSQPPDRYGACGLLCRRGLLVLPQYSVHYEHRASAKIDRKQLIDAFVDHVPKKVRSVRSGVAAAGAAAAPHLYSGCCF